MEMYVTLDYRERDDNGNWEITLHKDTHLASSSVSGEETLAIERNAQRRLGFDDAFTGGSDRDSAGVLFVGSRQQGFALEGNERRSGGITPRISAVAS